ncbi:hypothetical protein HYFRA_00010863 [Hymenoscyphus fraxineus]|uniref:NAD(P)-binding protein n=1 Tax=Hymenoscyphus fraxineus TaxID=746836 RepID=A0A9N9PTV6_9HELO|nr:hypothetical protein HYFRA_00010863 [Hymenoscyphus fraxineus]
MTTSEIDPNQWTTPFSFTKTIRRDPYPFLSPEKAENRQEGKVIIVTGAGSGIGAAAAKVWARAGAHGVVLVGRRLERLEIVKTEIEALNKDTIVLAVKCDIANESDVVTLYAEVKKTFGRNADVLLNNAGAVDDTKKFAEHGVEEYWRVYEINLKGLVIMLNHWINSQEDTEKPVGTVITVLTGRVGIMVPKGSSYDVSKLAMQGLVQHVQAGMSSAANYALRSELTVLIEYPTLRMFMTMPGIVKSEMSEEFWLPFAIDHADLTGLQALYFAQPRADYLKGLMTSVNWDHEVMEAHKEEIIEKKMLEMKWIPAIPFCGGEGLGA